MQPQSQSDPHTIRNAALLTYYRDPIGFLAQLPDRSDGVCPITGMSSDPIFVYDAVEVARILNARLDFVRTGAVNSNDRKAALTAVSHGLLSMNGAEHAIHRSSFLTFFRDRTKRGQFATTVLDQVRSATADWQIGDSVDIESAMRTISFSVLCNVALGLTASSQIGMLAQAIEEWIDYCLAPNNRLMNKHDCVPDHAEHLSQRIVDTLDELVLSAPTVGLPGPVRWLLKQRAAGEIDSHAVYGQVVTLLTAAWETTSSALSWACLLLAHHPDVAAGLTEEVADIPSPADWEVLDHLPLLDGTVKETLRLCSPAIGVKRNSVGEQRIRGLCIREGTEIICAQYLRHRDPAIFPDPLRFIPTRWIDCKPRSADYFPFGLGWRRCVGDHLAMIEFKVTIATLVRNFAFAVPPGTRVDRRVRLALSPKDGLRLRLAPSGHWDCSIWAGGDWRDLVELPTVPS
jgi:cytochrome P450